MLRATSRTSRTIREDRAAIPVLTILPVLFLLLSVTCGPALAVDASYQPWSGYWWPKVDGDLVYGYGHKHSPLEKYDYVTSGTYLGPARSYGVSHYYDPDALPWEGLCYEWAATAISESEPVLPGVVDGTVFYVGDKKGLLAAAYTAAVSTFIDVSDPVDFHATLTGYVGDLGVPIIVDLGAMDEIWSHPVFRYTTSYTQSGDVRHYTTVIEYATYNQPDDAFLLTEQETYNYYFRLDGETIVESGWEGDSVTKVPSFMARTDYISPLLGSAVDIDTVRAIAATDDDDYRGNATLDTAAEMTTGSHTLLAIQDDYFRIPATAQDTLRIRLRSEYASGVVAKLYTPDLNLAATLNVDAWKTLTLSQAGDYILVITRQFPNALYWIDLDQRHANTYMQFTDSIGQWQTGLGLAPAEGEIDHVIVSRQAGDGLPSQGRAFSNVAELHGTLADDLDIRPGASAGCVVVSATQPLEGASSLGNGAKLLAGANLVPLSQAGSSLDFPHWDNTGEWQTVLGVRNVSSVAQQVQLEAFAADGSSLGTQSVEIAAAAELQVNIYDNPIMNGAATMRATALSGEDCLLGYGKYSYPASKLESMALVSFVPGEAATDLVVSHVAFEALWWTGVVVMNTGDAATTVRIVARDSAGGQLSVSTHELAPHQKLVTADVDLLCPGADPLAIASMELTSLDGEPLTGFVLYGATSGKELAGVSMAPPDAEDLYLPSVADVDQWWNGVGLYNAGSSSTVVALSLEDDAGEIASVVRQLPGHGHLAATVSALFGQEQAARATRLVVRSNNGSPLAGVYLHGSLDGELLEGDVLARVKP